MASFIDFLSAIFSKSPAQAPQPAASAPTAEPIPAPQTAPVVLTPAPVVFAPPVPVAAPLAPSRGVGITIAHLVAMGASPANAAKYCKAYNDACERYDITSQARICAFVSQTFEESGCLSRTRENLNYTIENLMTVWPHSFPNAQSTAGYVMNPEALANKQYGRRDDNTQPGDGWKYSGRGVIQITFRDNYEPCGKSLGIDLVNHPELLEQPEYAVMSAGWYWRDQAHCNELADGDSVEAMTEITRKINGGLTRLTLRLDLWRKAKSVFAEFK